MVSQFMRGRVFARPAGRMSAAATSKAALAGVASAWTVLTVVFSVAFHPPECVDADGITGFVAANFAQMTSVAECPTGTLGYGPHTVAVVAAASALLAAGLIAQVAAGLMGYWAGRATRAVHRLITGLGRALPQLRCHLQPAECGQVRNWYSTAVTPPFPVRAQWRRGPPLAA